MRQKKDNVSHPSLNSWETTSKDGFLYFCLTFAGYEFYKNGKLIDKWEAHIVFQNKDFDSLYDQLISGKIDKWEIKESSWPEQNI